MTDNERMSACTSVAFYSEGSLLAAQIYPAPRDRGSGPAVVLCHGFTGLKEWLLPPFGQVFSEAGITALTFDYRGFGGSEGVRGRLHPAEQIEDIRNAVTFLATVDGIDPQRIGLWGTSFGGANVIVAAALDARVRAVCSQVGFGNGRRAVAAAGSDALASLEQLLAEDRRKRVREGRGAMVDPTVIAGEELRKFFEHAYEQMPQLRTEIELASVERILDYVPEAYAGAISPRPLLLLACEQDRTAPVEEARELFNRAGEPKKLHILRGKGHFEIYTGEGFEEAVSVERDFFIRHL